jgi:sugar phosphate isomerase/epimerase
MSATIPFQFGVSQFTTNPWPFERDIETYAQLAIDTIEVCERKLRQSHIETQLAMVPANGLSVSSVQPVVRTLFPSQSQPEPRDVAQRMARFRQSIETIAPFTPGAPFVTNTGIPPNGNMQQVLDTAVAEYRTLAQFAAGYDVSIAVEPLNPSIMNVESAIWTLTQAMRLVDAVDRENFGICLDTWNIWQDADVEAEILACGDRIFVVQVSDWRTPRSYQDRLVVGQGEIPFPVLLGAIHESGFRGPYSLEIFSSGVPDALWDGDMTQAIVESRDGLLQAWHAAFTQP